MTDRRRAKVLKGLMVLNVLVLGVLRVLGSPLDWHSRHSHRHLWHREHL